MDTVLFYALAVGLAGLGLLWGVAAATEPVSVALRDIPAHSGRLVVVEARVLAAEALSSGAMRLVLSDGDQSVHAFVRDAVGVAPGDDVRVTGRAAKYRGQWEVVVDDAQEIRVISRWQQRIEPLDYLVHRPWTYIDSNVRTRGVWEAGSRLPVYVVDIGTNARMRLTAVDLDEFPDTTPVVVNGVMEYDATWNRFGLRVSEITAWPG